VHSWLQGQPVGLSIEEDLDVSTVVGNAETIMHSRHGIRIVSAVLLGTNVGLTLAARICPSTLCFSSQGLEEPDTRQQIEMWMSWSSCRCW